MNKYANYITNVSGFPKPGIQFKDITTLLETPDMLREVTKDMLSIISQVDCDKIVCADARGFIFGAALSALSGIPLVLARKPGKLPRPGLSVSYDLEYGSNTLEVSAGSIDAGDHCVIVDDLLATGGSAHAIQQIIARLGGIPTMCIVLIELMDLEGRSKLLCPVRSLVKYGIAPGETIVADLEGIVDIDQLRYYGTAALNARRVDNDFVYVDWQYEDRVGEKAIPLSKVKSVVGLDSEGREYLE